MSRTAAQVRELPLSNLHHKSNVMNEKSISGLFPSQNTVPQRRRRKSATLSLSLQLTVFTRSTTTTVTDYSSPSLDAIIMKGQKCKGRKRERKSPWDLAKKDKEAKDSYFFFFIPFISSKKRSFSLIFSCFKATQIPLLPRVLNQTHVKVSKQYLNTHTHTPFSCCSISC